MSPLRVCGIPSLALVALTLACDRRALPDPEPDVGWATYNLNYESTRSSRLAQIDTGNVSQLAPVCRVRLGEEGTLEAGPIVIGDTLIVTSTHTTVALDATTCRLIWRFVDPPTKTDVNSVNRGVAYLDGRVFRGTPDGRLVALSSGTGRVMWNVPVGNAVDGEFLSSAPIAWHGTVFMGLAGSDWGVRGRMMAFDAATGKEKWRFWTVPMGEERGAKTWQNPASALHGGGGTWSSFTLDTVTNELFVPVGNPAPDYVPGSRPGDDLYTNSVVVLDATSGAFKWSYQLTPADGFDYDLGAAPVLYTDATGAQRVLLASKDGYVYSLDRHTHALDFKTAVTTVKRAGPVPTATGIYACPGALGGVEWNGPSFDAASRTIYVGAVDVCGVFSAGPGKYVPGGFFWATNFTHPISDSSSGWLTAVDAQRGDIKWKFHAPEPIVAGVTTTAGGLVFTGDLGGNFYAFDKATGKMALRTDLGGAIAGGVVTYEVRGKQYVAVTAGNVSRMFGAGGSPSLVVLAVGARGQATTVNLPPIVDPSVSNPIEAGRRVFAICAACHGSQGEGGVGANLQTSRRDLAGVIAYVKNPTGSMPHLYPTPLGDSDVAAVAAYVMTLRKSH